jgi:hypothetical protein
LPEDKNNIPLYSPGDHIVGFFSVDYIESLKGVEIIRNRRGHAKRAYQKALTCHIVQHHPTKSNYGTCTGNHMGMKRPNPNEHLPSGYRIFTLQGLSVG